MIDANHIYNIVRKARRGADAVERLVDRLVVDPDFGEVTDRLTGWRYFLAMLGPDTALENPDLWRAHWQMVGIQYDLDRGHSEIGKLSDITTFHDSRPAVLANIEDEITALVGANNGDPFEGLVG